MERRREPVVALLTAAVKKTAMKTDVTLASREMMAVMTIAVRTRATVSTVDLTATLTVTDKMEMVSSMQLSIVILAPLLGFKSLEAVTLPYNTSASTPLNLTHLPLTVASFMKEISSSWWEISA